MSCGEQPNLLPSGCPMNTCDNILSDTKEVQISGSFTAPTLTNFRVEQLLGTASLSKILINNTVIPGGFSEVKEIKRKLIINQAKVIFDQLFVEGYILKNVSYVLPRGCSDIDSCKAYFNSWRDIEIKVPFSISTLLTGLINVAPATASTNLNYSILCNTMQNNCCDCGFMGDSLCENLIAQNTFLNELPYGRLIGYTITDLDISKKCDVDYCNLESNDDFMCDYEHNNLYNVLTEKINLNITMGIYVKTDIAQP